MKRKRFAAAALAGVMLLCAGCGQEEEAEEEAPSGTAVEVMEVTSGPMSAEYSLTGKVVAVSEVQVFPLLAGQVQTLSVEEGDTVSRGQTLFTVDTSTVTSTMGALQQSYSATKAATDRAIESAQLGVEQAELGVEQAQQAVDNAEALLEVGAAAEQDVTQARQGLQQAQAALSQAQAGVAQAQAQQSASLAQIQASMDQITTQAELGTVTAPCAGTVTAVNLVRGGMASSAQPAVVIAENGAVEVAASVAEDVYMDIRKGDNAGVVISALSDDMVNGTISEVPAAANAQTSLYDVSVSLPADVKPPIGAFATVTFYTDRRSDTISVPTEAILTGADDEQYVFVVDTYAEGDTAVRVTVETGLVSNTDTEILSGLAEGDRVVVKGQSYLSDGAAVRIVTGEDDLPADTADTAADAGGEG
ncbi:efflux RND transporter periplasmic adaptor subunit [Agathobaculum sp.]|uniref:efflux RND transporter periplasmic adaptor subunit n=1 Tax=Agathobaculum sp. TaxID=2048138 RepID=UPI001F984C79|nr:efflux RND transporter periplasmic adaptor subunit [Candidatus Agathobaculum intestinigallinarum]